jgi:hypothetical protein
MAIGADDRTFYIIAKTFDLAKDILRYGTYVAGLYFAAQIASVWAGKKTEASIVLGYFTSVENDYALPWIVTILSISYGFLQRYLRLRKTQYFQHHITQLEAKIDPKRTSSELLTTGETHPRDENL